MERILSEALITSCIIKIWTSNKEMIQKPDFKL